MRLSAIFGAVSAMLGVSAVSINSTRFVSSVTELNMSTPYASSHKNPNPNPIPVSAVYCFNHPLSHDDMQRAKEDLVKWSRHHLVHWRSHHAVSYPDVWGMGGVTWVVCNSKLWFEDHVYQAELDQVERVLTERCGKDRSGRVHSKKWKKSFLVVPQDWYKQVVVGHKLICAAKYSDW